MKLYLRIYNKKTSAPDCLELANPYEQHLLTRLRVIRLCELIREGFITINSYAYNSGWNYLEVEFELHKDWCMFFILSSDDYTAISIREVVDRLKLDVQIPPRVYTETKKQHWWNRR